VKVVAQQTIRVCIGHGHDVPGVESQEVAVVTFFDKNVFLVVAAVKDMVILAVLERNWLGHG
jgi:hypothetical protein